MTKAYTDGTAGLSKIACLLILALALTPLKSAAQSSILTPLNLSPQQLDQEQSLRYNKVRAQQLHSSYTFVRVEPLAASQQNGKVAVSFPAAPCPLTYFAAQQVDYSGSDEDYSWYGALSYEDSASDCDLGSLLLLARKGEHFGQLQVQRRTFELIELTGGVQLLAEIDTTVAAGGACGLGETARTTEPTTAPGTDFCKVRVLVLYTPAAKASEASIDNRIDLALSQAQQALLNSDIPAAALSLVLAGKQEVEYNEAPLVYDAATRKYSGGVLDDLNEMASGVLRAQVDRYRSLYQADLVLLLVKANPADGVNGVAALQDRNYPFAVVQSAIATGVSYTFAHELGHLLGADHEDDEGESSRPSTNYTIAHAHILHFKTTRGTWPFKKTYDNSRKTLVYGGSGGDPSVILNYSNPYVFHSSGVATGKTASKLGARNAARYIKDVACAVADYIPYEPGEFSVRVSGPYGRCVGYPATLTSNVSGPGGPYTYEWYSSADGINYSGVMGTGPTISFTMPPGPFLGAAFWKLRTSAPSGEQTYSTFAVKRKQSNCSGRFSGEPGIAEPAESSMVLSPVPASATVSADLLLAEPSDALSIHLYDRTGRIIRRLYSGKAALGSSSIALDVSGMANGLYFVQLQAGAYSTTQKLIIHH